MDSRGNLSKKAPVSPGILVSVHYPAKHDIPKPSPEAWKLPVGRTMMVANLGLYFARSNRTVVVVDLDPAGPALHGYLGCHLRVPTPLEQCAAVGVRWERIPGTQLRVCGPNAHFIGYDATALRRRILDEISASPSDVLIFDLKVSCVGGLFVSLLGCKV